MRKIIFQTIILVLVVTNLKAQSIINNFYIDGSYNFVKDNSISPFLKTNFSDPKQTQFGFNTNIGYKLSENFIIGLGFNYQQDKITFIEVVNLSTGAENIKFRFIDKKVTPSLFLKYLKTINSKITLGVRTNVGYQYDTDIIDISPNTIKVKVQTNEINITVSPLTQLFLTNKLGIQLSYTLFNVDFDFNRNPSDLKLGLFYYFDKRK